MGTHPFVDMPRDRFATFIRPLRWLAVASALLTAHAACQGGSEAPAAPDAATPAARLDGQILFADSWTKVAPPVLHDAKMDLATRCRLLQGEARGHGSEIPLCFSPARRTPQAITTLHVERDEALPRAMQRLTKDNEGAHFVIDRSGGIYQVLDLAHAARRAGAYQEGEIRVVACHAESEKALVAALHALYPAATVTIVPPPGATP